MGIRYNLVNPKVPALGDFIQLETINKDKTATRTIYSISPSQAKNSFKLGRGHEADVRISDISVSRCHALLKCTKTGFLLEDNHSKFGSLFLERDPIQLEIEKPKQLQIGRTLLTLLMIPVKNISDYGEEIDEENVILPEEIQNKTVSQLTSADPNKPKGHSGQQSKEPDQSEDIHEEN